MSTRTLNITFQEALNLHQTSPKFWALHWFILISCICGISLQTMGSQTIGASILGFKQKCPQAAAMFGVWGEPFAPERPHTVGKIPGVVDMPLIGRIVNCDGTWIRGRICLYIYVYNCLYIYIYIRICLYMHTYRHTYVAVASLPAPITDSKAAAFSRWDFAGHQGSC